MQTILGAGGVIGKELARSLTKYTTDIRLVSRNPSKVNDTDTLFSADLTNGSDVLQAVEGSEIVYLTVGLAYKTKIWQDSWPLIMSNVIAACTKHKCKLVFFDNVYMYDPQSIGHMTEANPVAPTSKKGQVRALIAEMVLDAHRRGKVETLIARAADFYGPDIGKVSVLTETIFNPLSQGKKASVLGALDFKPKHQVAGKFLTKIIGLFVPIMGELVEMFYQYDQDYVFSSEKFERTFGIRPTSYKQGLTQVIQQDYKNS